MWSSVTGFFHAHRAREVHQPRRVRHGSTTTSSPVVRRTASAVSAPLRTDVWALPVSRLFNSRCRERPWTWVCAAPGVPVSCGAGVLRPVLAPRRLVRSGTLFPGPPFSQLERGAVSWDLLLCWASDARYLETLQSRMVAFAAVPSPQR